MTDNTAIARKVYEDFGRGDIPAVGPQQVLEQIFLRIPRDYDGFAITVGRIVGLGDTVLVEGRYTGTGRATGLPLDAQVAHVWDFRHGKVHRFQQYVDTAQLRRVLDAERVHATAG
jgi:ketosteroid isomerase-like protein